MRFKFCPICKNDLKMVGDKTSCDKCGYIKYVDVVTCVSFLPIKDGKVLLAIRKNEPHKGELDQLGGFLEPNETAEEGAIREAKEETGANIKIIKLLGTYPDRYGEDGVYTLNIQYLVEIEENIKANDDVSELVWVEIKDIPNIKFNGFKNTKETLIDLYKEYVAGRGAEN